MPQNMLCQLKRYILLAKLPTRDAGWTQYLIITVIARIEFCTHQSLALLAHSLYNVNCEHRWWRTYWTLQDILITKWTYYWTSLLLSNYQCEHTGQILLLTSLSRNWADRRYIQSISIKRVPTSEWMGLGPIYRRQFAPDAAECENTDHLVVARSPKYAISESRFLQVRTGSLAIQNLDPPPHHSCKRVF